MAFLKRVFRIFESEKICFGMSMVIVAIVFGNVMLAFMDHYSHKSIFPSNYLYKQLCILFGFVLGVMYLYLSFKGDGWLRVNDAVTASGTNLSNDINPTGKRDQQHQIILAVIDTLNYEPLQIPTRGKARIKDVCLKRVRVFTDDGFKRAWQEGLDAGLFRLLDNDKFTSK